MDASECFEKRLPHYEIDEWHERNKLFESTAKSEEEEAIKSRREGSEFRSNNTNVEIWKHQHSNWLLDQRIHDVAFWLKNLGEALKSVEQYLVKVSEVKNCVEEAIKKNKLLFETTKEIISLRDHREDTDLVEDEPYKKLKTEKSLLESAIQRLEFDADENFKLINDLVDRKQKLSADIRDKKHTLNTENHMRDMTQFTIDEISLKPWPKEMPEINIHAVEWITNTMENIRVAVEVVEFAHKKIAESKNLIRDVNNDVGKCRESTTYALSRRHQQELDARDSLASQRKVLIDRAARLREENSDLETALADNMNNTKLVHTKLEDRNFRQKKELCFFGLRRYLLEEEKQISDSRYGLTRRMEDYKILKNQIDKQILDIETELQRKEKTLAVAMAARNLHSRPVKSPYQTEIYWMTPVGYNDFVRGSIQHHLNAREFVKMNREMQFPGFIDHRIQELASTFPIAEGKVYHPTDVSRLVCEHW